MTEGVSIFFLFSRRLLFCAIERATASRRDQQQPVVQVEQYSRECDERSLQSVSVARERTAGSSTQKRSGLFHDYYGRRAYII